jgi:hypothetical protein
MSKTNKALQKITRDRASADQGDFFFANVMLSDGKLYQRPVFVIGKNNDSNDVDDIIVCSCTTSPARSTYDKPVKLKYDTLVRTNKLYTMGRSQILFKINHNLSQEIIRELLDSCNKAIS